MTTIALPRNQYQVIPPHWGEILLTILQIIFSTLKWSIMSCQQCNANRAELARTKAELARTKNELERAKRKLKAIEDYSEQVCSVTKQEMDKGNHPRGKWSYLLAGYRVSSKILEFCYA